MTRDKLIAAHTRVASRLLELVPRAGVSSRLTGLAVALERLGFADEALRVKAAETSDRVATLHDLSGALARWTLVDAKLTDAERRALDYASLLLRVEADEIVFAYEAA